ncbi:IS607 family transposase [Rhodoferax sp. 4810]|uniref:IS607 family transposase n=1 Tax=Thiospirillum jenense TaxID=1653858 RepID=A0A839HLC5_9GAMM|nr:IS607 family transposase [Thiospirillum jenense]MBB1078015.1 IS607 family transposase [Rhodoferax jenense]MBB1127358.1 IS607 family transposase [Thiospirillum jenense]
MSTYVTTREAAKRLGCHPETLRRWANAGKIPHIRTSSGQRRYDVDAYLRIQTQRIVISYCRVSSFKQRHDLDRQVQFMRNQYPQAEIIKDIGSGLNFKRKGLKTILERAMRGDCIQLVVAHRDRLARFGYELIQQVIEHNGGELVVLDQTSHSPEHELTKDLLNILHVFSYRMHGLSNYKKQVNQALTDTQSKKDI